MSKTGDVCTVFAVYKNTCCGREIIIRPGASFPECSSHSNVIATWEQIEVEIPDTTINDKKKNTDTAA